jgi:hypothetical protein
VPLILPGASLVDSDWEPRPVPTGLKGLWGVHNSWCFLYAFSLHEEANVICLAVRMSRRLQQVQPVSSLFPLQSLESGKAPMAYYIHSIQIKIDNQTDYRTDSTDSRMGVYFLNKNILHLSAPYPWQIWN